MSSGGGDMDPECEKSGSKKAGACSCIHRFMVVMVAVVAAGMEGTDRGWPYQRCWRFGGWYVAGVGHSEFGGEWYLQCDRQPGVVGGSIGGWP